MKSISALVLAAMMAGGCASASSAPSPAGRQAVLAPIDGLEVRVLESAPPQYVVNVRAGLPGGCAERNRYEVARADQLITVTVLNWLPAGNPICTAIYGSYELAINVGSDFRSGASYSVNVNDKTTTFVAR